MADSVDQLARKAAALLNAEPADDGAAAYRALLDADPDRPDDWYNLGFCLRRAHRFEEALEAYGQALDRGASGPEEIRLNRAVIYSDGLRQPDAAAKELEAALAIRPDYVPAWLNLGNLHEDRGAREEAEAAYRKALEVEPHNPLALLRLAEVTRFDTADHPLLTRLSGYLRAPNLPPMARADLGFALGRGYDQAGAYDRAFAAYEDGNRGTRQLAGAPYDPSAQEHLVDRIIAAFDVPASINGGPEPVFVCGMFRSGSTLAERILGAHSGLTAGGELEFIPAMVQRELQPYPEKAANLGTSDVTRLRERYLDGLDRIGLPGDRWIDKRPDNFLHIGLIKLLFPRARIVNTVRNPLDNCLSVFFAHLDARMTYAQSLDGAAHWYRQYQRLMTHWRSLYPDAIHDFDYDAMVADPRPNIEALLGFLGLEWEAACLEPHIGSGAVRTASAWQVREPLYTRSSGRWRNYQAHIAPLLKEFGSPAD